MFSFLVNFSPCPPPTTTQPPIITQHHTTTTIKFFSSRTPYVHRQKRLDHIHLIHSPTTPTNCIQSPPPLAHPLGQQHHHHHHTPHTTQHTTRHQPRATPSASSNTDPRAKSHRGFAPPLSLSSLGLARAARRLLRPFFSFFFFILSPLTPLPPPCPARGPARRAWWLSSPPVVLQPGLFFFSYYGVQYIHTTTKHMNCFAPAPNTQPTRSCSGTYTQSTGEGREGGTHPGNPRTPFAKPASHVVNSARGDPSLSAINFTPEPTSRQYQSDLQHQTHFSLVFSSRCFRVPRRLFSPSLELVELLFPFPEVIATLGIHTGRIDR